MTHDRFHGRIRGSQRRCDWPDCPEPGEFRAPGADRPGPDGLISDVPGSYRWFCLDHVRAFNAGYDFFAGMSAEEIWRAQSPVHGWERESRAFNPTGGTGSAPRWADFADPLDAISAHMRARMDGVGTAPRGDGRVLTSEQRRAFDVLGLPLNADRRALRQRYSELVRAYHPDRNGGDRRHEDQLQRVIDAWQLLRKAKAFG